MHDIRAEFFRRAHVSADVEIIAVSALVLARHSYACRGELYGDTDEYDHDVHNAGLELRPGSANALECSDEVRRCLKEPRVSRPMRLCTASADSGLGSVEL